MGDLTRSIGRFASGRLFSPTPTQNEIRPALEGDKSSCPIRAQVFRQSP